MKLHPHQYPRVVPIVTLLFTVALILAACGTSSPTAPQAEQPPATEMASATLPATATLTDTPVLTEAETSSAPPPITETDEGAATESATTTQEPVPNAPVTKTEEPVDETQTALNELTSQVRHWKGDPDAPVIFMDFSDFL